MRLKPHTGPAPSLIIFTCASTHGLNLQKKNTQKKASQSAQNGLNYTRCAVVGKKTSTINLLRATSAAYGVGGGRGCFWSIRVSVCLRVFVFWTGLRGGGEGDCFDEFPMNRNRRPDPRFKTSFSSAHLSLSRLRTRSSDVERAEAGRPRGLCDTIVQLRHEKT